MNLFVLIFIKYHPFSHIPTMQMVICIQQTPQWNEYIIVQFKDVLILTYSLFSSIIFHQTTIHLSTGMTLADYLE